MINPGTLPTPWYIYIGGTFNPLLTWTDSSGNPINLTGYSVAMDIAPYAGSNFPIATLTNGNGISISNATAGQIQISMLPAQTITFNPQNAVFDLQLTSSGGEVDYLLQGNIVIQQMVTP